MKSSSDLFTFPTILTLFRLLFSPFLLPVLLIHTLPFNSMVINSFLAVMFFLVSFTDFLDGYLARKWSQESELGKVLDPIADKFLLYSTLIALLVVGRIYYYWVIIFIGREFFVMGLRLVAAEHHTPIHVSFFGKIKTVVQFLYLTLLILNPSHLSPAYAHYGIMLQYSFLALALVLTIGSAYWYYKECINVFRKKVSDHVV